MHCEGSCYGNLQSGAIMANGGKRSQHFNEYFNNENVWIQPAYAGK